MGPIRQELRLRARRVHRRAQPGDRARPRGRPRHHVDGRGGEGSPRASPSPRPPGTSPPRSCPRRRGATCSGSPAATSAASARATSGCSSRSPTARVLEPGDQVEVQLSIRAKHAAEYVHLRDPRGAGFEPESLTSGWRWDLGHRLLRGDPRLRHQLLLRVAAGRRVHPQVPAARQHGRHLPGRPGHPAVDVRARVHGLQRGQPARDWGRRVALIAEFSILSSWF